MYKDLLGQFLVQVSRVISVSIQHVSLHVPQTCHGHDSLHMYCILLLGLWDVRLLRSESAADTVHPAVYPIIHQQQPAAICWPICTSKTVCKPVMRLR